VLLFLLLELISFTLLYRFNTLQSGVMDKTASNIAGGLFKVENAVTGFVGQRKENRKLAQENAVLQAELFKLRDSAYVASLPNSTDAVTVARVVDNSIRKDNNYITIDKGVNDGLEEGMGVYASEGVVGIVYRAGDNFSLVMPLINGKSSISCCVKRLDSFGFVEWSGGDTSTAWLRDLPSHSGVAPGDTVVTSGFSATFPKNIPVGVVSVVEEDDISMTPMVEIRLAVDFSRLGFVYVSGSTASDELLNLQKENN